MTPRQAVEAATAFAKAKKPHLFTDSDGTLVPFFKDPLDAKPSAETKQRLTTLVELGVGTTVVSGRSERDLDLFYGDLAGKVGLVGEHGTAFRMPGDDKFTYLLSAPKCIAEVQTRLEAIARELGAGAASGEQPHVEVKATSRVLHWRALKPAADKQFDQRVEALVRERLSDLIPQGLEVDLDDRVLEVRPHAPHINKGSAIETLVGRYGYDCIGFAGDAKTDEFAHRAINGAGVLGISVKVGDGDTVAKLRVASPAAWNGMLDLIIASRSAFLNSNHSAAAATSAARAWCEANPWLFQAS